MKPDTTFLERCVQALEKALELLNKTDQTKIEYDMYRAVCIKEFEIIQEQTGELLKKCLRPYFGSPIDAERLFYKDIFWSAADHKLLTSVESKRWLQYRDDRDITAYDQGAHFAEETQLLLPQFIEDSKKVISVIQKQ